MISYSIDRVCICAFRIQSLESNTQIHNMLDLRIESKKPLMCNIDTYRCMLGISLYTYSMWKCGLCITYVY